MSHCGLVDFEFLAGLVWWFSGVGFCVLDLVIVGF